jgi:hypothetical protein
MTKKEIQISKEKQELQLNFWQKTTHYGIVIGILIIPTTIMFVSVKDILNGSNKHFSENQLWFIIIPILISILFYFLQKNRLKFKVIDTSLNVFEIKKIITEIEEQRKWIKNKNTENYYTATTYPGFFSGSWGELITIIFAENRIYFNSICNPNAKSSVVSMGRNKKHYLTLLNRINQASH